MAKIPTPRSLPQIEGDMYDAFTSEVGLSTIKIGSPVLSIFDAAAQSDLRNSQDTFQLLATDDLDKCEGTALDRKGADEERPRITETPSSGFVTISDTSFAKLTTKIYQGQGAPIVGSDKLFVSDASGFPASGSVYVGRGTTNYEGPLLFTAKIDHTTYWELSLDVTTHTTKFHNLAEVVTLAQGGNRPIAAGQVVQTPQGNVSAAIQFSTLYSAVIPDGETSVERVTVIALKPGVIGNIPAGTVNAFVSPPFSGAGVTNPLPYTNALATEDDRTYREAIRAARRSRVKGTKFAITNAVIGKTSPDENKRIASASYVIRKDVPDTVYIDDGTGYEEQSQGNPLETLYDAALGGEQDFQVAAPKPVTKAFIETLLTAPFVLPTGSKLAVKVNGMLEAHSFVAQDFQSIGNAGAYEVSASINADASLTYGARTSSSGTKVSLFAKDDTNEDLEVVAPEGVGDIDANPFLGFSAGKAETLLVYKNDRLLSKDGNQAIVTSNSQSSWGPMSGSQTLTISVDGTAATTYTVTDLLWITAATGYSSLATSNSLEAWAKVLNALIPGVTTTATSGELTMVSNLGRSARASIAITGGTLLSNGRMFSFNTGTSLEATGQERDYTFNRNTGQGRLTVPLAVGDSLTVGSSAQRAFIESTQLPATTLATDGHLWMVVDGEAAVIATGLSGSSAVSFTKYDPTPDDSWGERVRITSSAGAPFSTVLTGDWALFLDTNLNAANRGAWRVTHVDAGFTYFEIEKAALTAEGPITLSGGGIKFIRTAAQLQKVIITAATNYTAATFVDAINATLLGATAEVYRTNRFRIRTNTFASNGDIALVGQNTMGSLLGLTVTDAVANLNSHVAAVQSGNSEDGTPVFFPNQISAVTNSTQFTAASATGVASNSILKMTRRLPGADGGGSREGFGTNTGRRFALQSASGTTVHTRVTPIAEWLPQDRFVSCSPYAISAKDDFTVLMNNDEASHRYSMNMFRRIAPTTTVYGSTNFFTDTDGAGASLALGFGTGFEFNDFAVFMKSRTKSHAEAGDTTKTILWRYNRFGPDGNVAKVRYVYPTAASQAVSVAADPQAVGFEGNVLVNVRLPSSAARSGTTIRNSAKIGAFASTSGSLQLLTYILGYSISSALRNVTLNYDTQTGNFTVGQVITGAITGATGTIVSDADAGATGTLVLSSVTGSFADNETITDPITGSAAVNGTQIGVTTLTLDIATPGAADHGFAVSDKIWVASSSGSFSSGVKPITARTASTISYIESTTSVGATASIGTVSFDTIGNDTLTGSTVVANDIVNFSSVTSLPTGFQLSMRISTLGAQYLNGLGETTNGTSGIPTWYNINNAATGISFFPLDTGANTAAQIAAAVHALAAVANTTSPVDAVGVGAAGVATGVIGKASFDEFTTAGYGYTLSDGVNWVKAHNTPVNTSANFSFDFKDSTAAGLATNSDWAAEEVRLVPITAKNVVGYGNTLAVSGLASAAELSACSEFGSLGISSLTAGSDGAVEVQGGMANAVSGSLLGSSAVVSTYMLSTLAAAEAEGLTAGMWVAIENINKMPKNVFTGATSCTSISPAGQVVLTGTQAWTYANTATGLINGFPWQIEKHGRYTAFVWTGIGAAPVLTGISENAWVIISNATSSANTGTFRVVRCDTSNKVFWIENPNTVTEITAANLWFLTYDSVMPGDTITIGTELWGADNRKSWLVASIDNSDVGTFSFDVSTQVPTAFTGPQALGTESSLVQCIEGTEGKLIKQIRSINTDPTNGTLVNVKFESSAGYKNCGAVAGSLLVALDKLAFPTAAATGIDGYRNSTGLIAEASRILYGDERDPATYPGVVAGGANVNLSGPLTKRITAAFAIRIRSTAVAADVIRRVKSAVAAVINGTLQGKPIAIIDLGKAAKSVNGVIAVTILSPAFNAGHDLIKIQPYEKPMVLDLEQDIKVSLVSE